MYIQDSFPETHNTKNGSVGYDAQTIKTIGQQIERRM